MSRARGLAQERRAERWLARRGYKILERNFTARGGEIDLVARDGDTLVFVEVRSRASARWGDAASSIDWRKRQRLSRAAAIYLTRHPCRSPVRFDVVAITGDEPRLLVDAFRPGE